MRMAPYDTYNQSLSGDLFMVIDIYISPAEEAAERLWNIFIQKRLSVKVVVF